MPEPLLLTGPAWYGILNVGPKMGPGFWLDLKDDVEQWLDENTPGWWSERRTLVLEKATAELEFVIPELWFKTDTHRLMFIMRFHGANEEFVGDEPV